MVENSSENLTPENKIVRTRNVATISRPEGTYSIAYGVHLGNKKAFVPEDVDGVCIESLISYPETEEELYRLAILNQKSFFNYAALHKIPIIANDCYVSQESFADSKIPPFELVAGLKFYKDIANILAKGGMNRRQFLKFMLAGSAATYFSLPAFDSVGRLASSFDEDLEPGTAEFSKVVRKIHPENGIITLGLRDAVAAQKMQYLLKYNTFEHLLATRGSLHTGIETSILATENDRLEFLMRLKPLLPKVVIDLKTLYQIKEYNFSYKTGHWEVGRLWEEPNLKQLVT